MFLCDHNIERSLADAVHALPGYRVITLQSLGMERSRDYGQIKSKANELKAVILTRDGDFLDEVNFRICTHPGVLRLKLPHAPSEYQPRVKAFLMSRHYKRCKHATVELHPTAAFVRAKADGPLVGIAYLSDS